MVTDIQCQVVGGARRKRGLTTQAVLKHAIHCLK